MYLAPIIFWLSETTVPLTSREAEKAEKVKSVRSVVILIIVHPFIIYMKVYK